MRILSCPPISFTVFRRLPTSPQNTPQHSAVPLNSTEKPPVYAAPDSFSISLMVWYTSMNPVSGAIGQLFALFKTAVVGVVFLEVRPKGSTCWALTTTTHNERSICYGQNKNSLLDGHPVIHIPHAVNIFGEFGGQIHFG